MNLSHRPMCVCVCIMNMSYPAEWSHTEGWQAELQGWDPVAEEKLWRCSLGQSRRHRKHRLVYWLSLCCSGWGTRCPPPPLEPHTHSFPSAEILRACSWARQCCLKTHTGMCCVVSSLLSNVPSFHSNQLWHLLLKYPIYKDFEKVLLKKLPKLIMFRGKWRWTQLLLL